jgi:hypothetical protein
LLGKGASAGALAGLARGVDGQAHAATVLTAIEHINAGDFAAAAAYILENRLSLKGPEKTDWVLRINALSEQLPGGQADLLRLSQLVVDCWT